MSETVTLTSDELAQVRSFQDRYTLITRRSGELAFQKMLLEREENDIKTEMTRIEESRIALLEALNRKYGAGSINMETGEFTPATMSPVQSQ